MGLVDGSLLCLDLCLGIEKYFFEKFPTQIESIAVFEEHCVIAGSLCGRINLYDLEET